MLYARMAWRDVRSRPVETVALLVVIAVSVLLATVSAGLLQAVSGASDRLLDQAEAPDVVQMHTGQVDADTVAAWAAERDDVAAHQLIELLTLDGARLSLAGVAQTSSVQQNSLMVPSTDRDRLLALDGEALVRVEPGTVWLPVYYAIEDGLGVGDTVTVTGADGFAASLTVAGFHRDAIMNTAIASSKRLAVSDADFAAIAAHTGTIEHLIEFWLDDPAGTGALAADYLAAGLPAAGPTVDRETFRLLTVIGEGINAGVVILAAVLLLIVGLLCLRLSLVTALRRERRELGVLKAIGIPSRAVAGMQLAKYGAIGAVACLLGLTGGLALLPVMSASLTAYAGTGASAWAAPVITAAAMCALVLVFVRVLLRRIGRLNAVQALRGDGVHGRWPGPRLTLHRSRRTPVGVRLGFIHALRSWSTHGLLAAVFAVATFIVIVPLTATMTLASGSFIAYMGVPVSDLRVEVPTDDRDALAELLPALDDDPTVERFTAHVTTRAELSDTSGSLTNVFLASGDHLSLPLAYAQGRPPAASSEVALSLVALARTGHTVGDVVEARIGDARHELTIVGAYQDITNGGSTARALVPIADVEVIGHTVTVALTPGSAPGLTAERIIAADPGVRVAEVDAYRSQTLGPITTQMASSSGVAAAVALALAALVTVMTTRMVLAADTGQIAIQRALGTPDTAVRTQYVTAVLTALAIGLPLGVLASATLGQAMFNLLFEGLYGGLELIGSGTSRIEFLADPVLTTIAVPLSLAAVIAAATLAACRDITETSIRKVVAE